MPIQLAAETEAALRIEANARGVSLEAMLSDAVQRYQAERTHEQPQTVSEPFKDRRREIAWTANPDLRYSGEWVAVEGSEVVAHGKDGHEVAAYARSKNIPSPFLFFVADPDPTPFVGGWLELSNE
jgi:hypothetical protein